MLAGVRKVEAKKLFFLLGFICALAAYSLHPFLWENAFYHLISFAFYFYVTGYKYEAKGWFLGSVWCVSAFCVSAIADELFFDPIAIEPREYLIAGAYSLIVYVYVLLFYNKQDGTIH